jgi:hypothetical protein
MARNGIFTRLRFAEALITTYREFCGGSRRTSAYTMSTCSRIPYYRLPQTLRDNPDLRSVNRLTLFQSFRCVRLVLWDESRKRLVSFRDVRTNSRGRVAVYARANTWISDSMQRPDRQPLPQAPRDYDSQGPGGKCRSLLRGRRLPRRLRCPARGRANG